MSDLPAGSLLIRHIRTHKAPFLVWPVARREFYTAISAALALPLLWGVLIFGWRAAVVLIATLCGAILAHLLLKKFTRRGKNLVVAHTILSTLLVVALSQALWSPLLMAFLGALLVGLIWLCGGAGHEPFHASLILILGATFLLAPPPAQRDRGPIVARDRLLMGDLMQSSPGVSHDWPYSYQIGGQDAVLFARPNVVVAELLAHITKTVEESQHPASTLAAATAPDLHTQVQDLLNKTLVSRLPTLPSLLLGLTPGPIGAVSAFGIVLGGLYLAYRNILRPTSCALFLVAAVVGLVLSTFFTWGGGGGGGVEGRFIVPGVGGPWQIIHVEEMLTLLFYVLFSSDILLAAVFLLALPGSEPITPRARRWFLIFAGVLAGFLQRANLPVPAATLVVFAFSPVAPLFDTVLARKSWLSRPAISWHANVPAQSP